MPDKLILPAEHLDDGKTHFGVEVCVVTYVQERDDNGNVIMVDDLDEKGLQKKTENDLIIKKPKMKPCEFTLVITDGATTDGTSAVFITKPFELDFSNLEKFFKAKGIVVPEALKRLMNNIELVFDALYYSPGKKEELPSDVLTDANKKKEWVQKLLIDEQALKNIYDNTDNTDGKKIITLNDTYLLKFSIKTGNLLASIDKNISNFLSLERASLMVVRCQAGKAESLKNYVKMLNSTT